MCEVTKAVVSIVTPGSVLGAFLTMFPNSWDNARGKCGKNRMWLILWKQKYLKYSKLSLSPSMLHFCVLLPPLISIFSDTNVNTYMGSHRTHLCRKSDCHYCFLGRASGFELKCCFRHYIEQHVRQCHPGRTGVGKSSCLVFFQ